MISKADLLALTDQPYGSHLAWQNAFREGGKTRLFAILDVLDAEVLDGIADEQVLRFLLEKIRQGQKQEHARAWELEQFCQERLRVVLGEKGWSWERARRLARFFRVARWVNLVVFAILFIVTFLSEDVGTEDSLQPFMPILSVLQLLALGSFVTLGQLRQRLLTSNFPFYQSEPLLVNLVKGGLWLGVLSCLNFLLTYSLLALLVVLPIQFGLLLWMRWRIYTSTEVGVLPFGTGSFWATLCSSAICLLSLPKLVLAMGWSGLLIPLPGIVVGGLLLGSTRIGYGHVFNSPKKFHQLVYVVWWLLQQVGLFLATCWSVTGLLSPAYLMGYDWLYGTVLVLVLGSVLVMVGLVPKAKAMILSELSERDGFIFFVSRLYLFLREDKKGSGVAARLHLLATFVSKASVGWFSVLAHKSLVTDLALLEEVLEELSCQYILEDLTWLKSLYPGGWEQAGQLIKTGRIVPHKDYLSQLFRLPDLQNQLMQASNRLVQQRLMLLWKLYDYYKQHEDEIRPYL